MDDKRNKILMGVILLIIGFMSLWQNVFRVNYFRAVSFILLFVSGFSFLLLYRTKRKGWSLCIGCYLVYIALLTVNIGRVSLVRWLLPAMTFIVPGVILLILCFDKGKRGFLVPGFVLFWFGIFIILTRFSFLQSASEAIFFTCMGLSFACARYMGRPPAGRWTVVTCALCYLIALQRIFGPPFFERILNLTPAASSGLIIIVAVIIITRAAKGK